MNSLNVHPGERVSVCYKVKNAQSVQVTPGRPMNLAVTSPEHGCVFDVPKQTTTYTVTARGGEGMTDSEHVTVKVR